MSAVMHNDGPRDNNELHKIADRAIERHRSWVEDRTPSVRDADEVIRGVRDEFVAKVKAKVCDPRILASPERTFGLLRTIVGWWISDRAISRHLAPLRSWVEERMPSVQDADEIVRGTCDEFAADVWVHDPEILASPERTSDLLRAIASRRIERRRIVDWAISRHLAPLRSWVEERTPCVQDADKVVRGTCGEFVAKAEAWKPEILASPGRTFGLLCSISRKRIVDRAISCHRDPLRDWIKKEIKKEKIRDAHVASDEVTQKTCIEFAAEEGYWPEKIDSLEGPEILASPKRTYGVLKAIAKYEIFEWRRREGKDGRPVDPSAVGGRIRRGERDVDPSGEEVVVVEDPNPSPVVNDLIKETKEQIQRDTDRWMEALDDQQRLVIILTEAKVSDEEIAKHLDEDLDDQLAATPSDQERNKILETAKANVRQIRCRAYEVMAENAGQDFCEKLAGCLNDRERKVVDTSCWDDPSDEETARRLGTNAEDVRRTRNRAFDKLKIRASELGVPWNDLETRVAWASHRVELSEKAIALGIARMVDLAGVLDDWEREVVEASCWDDPSDEETARRLGTTAKDVRKTRNRAFNKLIRAIRRPAREKMSGQFDH